MTDSGTDAGIIPTPQVSRKDRTELLRSYCQRELWNSSSSTRTTLRESAQRDAAASQQELLVTLHRTRNETVRQLHRTLDRVDQEIIAGLSKSGMSRSTVTEAEITEPQILESYVSGFIQDFSRRPNDEESEVLRGMARQAHTYILPIRNAVDMVLSAQRKDGETDTTAATDELLTRVRAAAAPPTKKA